MQWNRGLHRDINTWSQESLEAVLEAGYHSREACVGHFYRPRLLKFHLSKLTHVTTSSNRKNKDKKYGFQKYIFYHSGRGGVVGQYLTAHLSASATIGKMNQEEKVFNR